MIAFFERHIDKYLIQRTVVLRITVQCRIEHYAFLYHFLRHHIVALHKGEIISFCLWRCRHTYFYFWIKALQNLGCTFGCFGIGKHMLLVDNYYHFNLVHTRTSHIAVQRFSSFVFAHHHIFFFVDAFPVHKQHLVGFEGIVGNIFVLYGFYGTQFGKIVFERHITLKMQLVRSYPHKSHFAARQFHSVGQFFAQFIQKCCHHHRFA